MFTARLVFTHAILPYNKYLKQACINKSYLSCAAFKIETGHYYVSSVGDPEFNLSCWKLR